MYSISSSICDAMLEMGSKSDCRMVTLIVDLGVRIFIVNFFLS